LHKTEYSDIIYGSKYANVNCCTLTVPACGKLIKIRRGENEHEKNSIIVYGMPDVDTGHFGLREQQRAGNSVD
jgi:hypothetical protein